MASNTTKRRVKDKFFESNHGEVHKGFVTSRTKTELCKECNKASRHFARTFVLKDKSVHSTVTCLHCFNQKVIKHDASKCTCVGCTYVKTSPKAVKDKTDITDMEFLKDLYDKVENKIELNENEAKIFLNQFKSDSKALLAFINVLKS